jgi:hypothetical protein
MSAADLAIMRRIYELHLDYPFAGQPDAVVAWRGKSGHDDDA